MITDSVSSLCHMFSLPAVSVTHVILGSLLHYKFVEALVLACPLLLQAWAKDPHNPFVYYVVLSDRGSAECDA